MRGFFRELLITLALAVAVFLLLQTVIQTRDVIGRSMEPTLYDGERLIIDRVSYRLHEPERGDIVIFHPPNNPQTVYIKRIIGLPGDVVEVMDGAVYVNGQELDEPYIKDKPKYTLAATEIPAEEYFVLGDNRTNSNDSHNGWTVAEESIIGKAWVVIWPPDEWPVFAASTYAIEP